jgi:hypothetical protein
MLLLYPAGLLLEGRIGLRLHKCVILFEYVGYKPIRWFLKVVLPNKMIERVINICLFGMPLYMMRLEIAS